MHFFNHRTAAIIGITAIPLCTPALADSSSAFSASSTAIGSVSTSVEKSSDSSSGKRQIAQGTYTVVAMEPITEQQDTMRLRLVGVTPATTMDVALRISRRTVEYAQLAVGQRIAVDHRPYGLALAKVGARGEASTFFLVLADDWYQELESRQVVL